MRTNRLVAKLAFALLTACFVVSTTATPIVAQPLSSIDDETLIAGFEARLDDLSRSIQSGRDRLQIQPEMVSVAAIAMSLGARTPEGASSYIHEHFSFDPYEGSLRGARGTVFARGGNALDRSLLLGAILDELRVPWRLVRGQLAEEQAIDLLLLSTLTGSYSGVDVPDNAQSYDPAFDLRGRGTVQRHFWVQAEVRGDWIDLDPTFPGRANGPAVTDVLETFDDGQPAAADVHSVTISVHHDGTNASNAQVLSHSGPLHHLAYRNLTLTMARDALGAPNLVPHLAVADDVVTGRPIATNGLRRVWVEYFFRLGASEHRVVRDLYSSDSQFNFFDLDQQVFSVVILPGFVGPDYYRAVLNALLNDFAEIAQGLRSAAQAQIAAGRADDDVSLELRGELDRALVTAMGVASLSFATVSDELALRVAATLGVRPFYRRPRVIMTGAFRRGDELFYQIDLRYNAMDSVVYEGVPPAAAFAFNAVRGRVDSQLEGVVLQELTGVPSVTVDAVFNTARSESLGLRTVHAGNVNRIASTSLSTEAQRRITESVSNQGRVVLIPSDNVDIGDLSAIAWWRIEPASGHVIGVMENGVHQGLSILTGQPVGARATGVNVPVRVVDRTLTLIQTVVDQGVAIATQEADFANLICAARCDLNVLRGGVCSDRPGPVLASCLRGQSVGGGGDVLQVSATCGALVLPFSCGAELFDSALLRLVDFRPYSGTFTGPWGMIRAVSESECGC